MILLTGATGYIGGRLLKRLESAGRDVRCLARRPESIRQDSRHVEVVAGDLLDPASLASVMKGVETAVYLVHAMADARSFEDSERRAAENFALQAKQAGVKKIVYLGGLGSGDGLSPHLRSRHEVGRILRESGVPVIEFRAAVIIGSGSLSFELVRALVEKLPIMITPRWVSIKTQPIAVEDVLDYLAAALDVPPIGAVYEIGGLDRVSYLDIMKEYARQRGLRRWMIRVPVLTPRLSSLWLGLVTPIYARIGARLIESIRNETIVKDNSALTAFSVRPRGLKEAILRALANEDREFSETRWSDALSSSGLARPGASPRGTRLVDSRRMRVAVPPTAAFRPIARIGGEAGWYYAQWLWRLRGFMDLLAGGVGLRRGRKDPDRLLPGDALDFWRVESIEQDRLLRLVAEMKVPGKAWLQFEIDPEGDGSVICQTAIFQPAGLLGLLYWYGLLPFHRLIFRGMLKGIAKTAAEGDSAFSPSSHAAP